MTFRISQTIIGFIICNSLWKFIRAQNDSDCRQDVKSHMLCMRREHYENQDLDNQTIRQAEDHIVQCFVNNNCMAPNFDEDKSILSFENGRRNHRRPNFQNVPSEVRQCMKENMRKTEAKKLNKCLQKHNVAQLGTEENEHPMFHNGNETVDGFRQFFMQHELINNAIIRCKVDNDETVASTVAECFHTIRSKVKKGLCPRLIGCEDEEVSPTCRRRGSDIRKALCKCRKECLADAIGNLDDLINLGRNIDRKDLLKAVGRLDENHEKDIFENMRQCYEQSGLNFKNSFASNGRNSDFNPILKFVSSTTSTVSTDELSNIKFILTIKYRDEDCDECN